MSETMICSRCGGVLFKDKLWIRAEKSMHLHLHCFVKYQQAKNRALHRNLPERLYVSVDEVKGDRNGHHEAMAVRKS